MGSPVTDGPVTVPLTGPVNESIGILNDGASPQNGSKFPLTGLVDPRDSSKAPAARDDTLNAGNAWSTAPTGQALDAGGLGFLGVLGTMLNRLSAIRTSVAGVAQDGTDPSGTNAGTQAGSTTTGVGVRGWLSTLVGLFQNGLARVQVTNLPGLGLLDGTSSAGTSSQGIFLFNGGLGYGPGGSGSTRTLDRARSIQGKVLQVATLNTMTAVGDTALSMLIYPYFVEPGTPIYLFATSGLGTPTEVVYAAATGPVSGSAAPYSIAIQTPVAYQGSTVAAWETGNVPGIGPGTNGFMPTGILATARAIFSVTKQQYVQKVAADQDNISPVNAEIDALGLVNTASGVGRVDRARAVLSDAQAPTGLMAVGAMLFNPSAFAYDRPRVPTNDGAFATGIAATGGMLYNGTTFDRARGVAGAMYVSTGGASAITMASGAGTTQIKNTPGRLCRVVVTATGTAAISMYDNNAFTGLPIAVIPASATLGQVFDFQIPFAIALLVSSPAASPAITITYY